MDLRPDETAPTDAEVAGAAPPETPAPPDPMARALARLRHAAACDRVISLTYDLTRALADVAALAEVAGDDEAATVAIVACRSLWAQALAKMPAARQMFPDPPKEAP